jgi:hypothetical protein
MKKFYSTILMLATMIAALSLTACGGSDSDEESENPSYGKKTLIIDDESFYAVNCSVEQTRNSGMYLEIVGATNPEFPIEGHLLVVRIAPNKVSELKEGDVFYDNKLIVRDLVRLNEIKVNSYDWNVLEGDITIKRITDMEMTIQINNLLLEHKVTKVKHTISGTAILNSATYDSKGNLLSFKEVLDYI